jgi:hypothetical protein
LFVSPQLYWADLSKACIRYQVNAVQSKHAANKYSDGAMHIELQIREVMDNRDATYLKRLAESRKKMLKELKVSVRVELMGQ